jgi:hypothetical protein
MNKWKSLKIFGFIALATSLLWACSKEFSEENGLLPSVTSPTFTQDWEFKIGTKLYQGPVDTAYLTTIGSGQILTIEGFGQAAGQEINLIITKLSGVITPGTYTTGAGGVSFVFSDTTGTDYQSNLALGSFSVNISSIDTGGVRGTFSGTSKESPTFTVDKIISDGKFSAKLKYTSGGGGGGGTSAVFTLGGSPGSCTGATINGPVVASVPFVPINTMSVQVNVTTPGAYSISTNTVNGISYSGTGTFTATGVQTVTLTGTGTPTAAGANNMTVTGGGGSCTVSVTALSAGSMASFTLGGSPGNCTSAMLAGSYNAGTALSAANTMTVQVNVTTVGTYTISTNSVNGILFAAAGTFTATGLQNVTLIGMGTPTAAGTNNMNVTGGGSTCVVSVMVNGMAGGAAYTLGGSPGGCTGATLTGDYTATFPLNTANTLTIQVNVTTVGTYSISTNTVNGFSFSATGTFTMTGAQPVVLQGTGTPIAGGTNNMNVTGGGSTCVVSIVTLPIRWTYTENSTIIYKGEFDTAEISSDPAFEAADIYLGNSLGDTTFYIYLERAGGSIDVGTYTLTGTTRYGEIGRFSASGGFIYDATVSPVDDCTIIITSVTATQIVGTFTGRCTDGLGGVFNITNGSFTARR